jgi:hypothetical protein
MSRKSAFFALAFLCSFGAVAALAQDAGVSGIPHGPGSIGGINNSVNDPSGIGNAAKIAPLPSPNISAPAVPTAAPVYASRRSAPAVGRVYRRTASLSRREWRGRAGRAAVRTQDRLLDQKMSICRGC